VFQFLTCNKPIGGFHKLVKFDGYDGFKVKLIYLTMTFKLLVVEDESGIRELLNITLVKAGYHVTLVGGVNEAIYQLGSLVPDLCILDWMLPDQSGLYLLRKIRAQEAFIKTPVIMLTARSAENDKVMAFDSGADDYLTKPFSPRELTARVAALLRRALPVEEEKIQVFGDAYICHNTFTVKVNDIHLKLQPTEFRFLQFLLVRPNWIFTRSKLIESVWGSRSHVDERTVDAHIMRLRKTLHPISHSLKIETVRGEGYRLTSVPGVQS